jgi:hypothetical protein
MSARRTFSTKRRIRAAGAPPTLANLAQQVGYVGSQYHKRNPQDYGLPNPLRPRTDKTLCDEAGTIVKEQALKYLHCGICRGMVDERTTPNGFPLHIWCVVEDHVFEATGPAMQSTDDGPKVVYHGYPIMQGDPFREVVLSTWKQRAPCRLPNCPCCGPTLGTV